MPFLLKKIASLFLLPLPIGSIFILIGWFLVIVKRARRAQWLCIFMGLLCILFFSLRVNAYYLINQLQLQYPPLLSPPSDATEIVVLGGGISGGKSYPPSITLGSASLSRLIEGIRQFHLLEKKGIKPMLILSGGRVFESPNEAGVMRNTAVMLGINPQSIIIENGSKDTNQEARYLKHMISQNHFILVTSAYHMPRAIALFRSLNMHPIAAPTQFFSPTNLKIRSYVPSSLGLQISDIAIHEYLGLMWGIMRGSISIKQLKHTHE